MSNENSGDLAKELVADGNVSISEACQISGLSRSDIYTRMTSGELPFLKFGRRRLIPRRALVEFMANRLIIDQP